MALSTLVALSPLVATESVCCNQVRLLKPCMSYTCASKVFPNNFLEKIFFPFISAEIKFSKNIKFSEIEEYRGFAMRYKHDPSISLILGAGNVSCIPLLDAIYHLVAKRSVVYIKLNPVNEYLLPVYEKVFNNFISLGYMVITKGTVEESKYMTEHNGIDHIHLTGSDET